ncbi:23S rRNA (cytidine(2498)-2'-O)-methyltransferase RlmM [Marinobacter sp. CHS3-4]|uniref:23S rRNA (cytidine(2498)-2'-O)-methyltransferase RlmM n=1 Tax=Marinobacter sp. CHS3-4 TaxID=3045174 RepID=UPI0024B5DAC5|nr:23S rRNA (cytidine(2498)-2'-O)-methyltransferase RlmM [Marinobacter sp. CHS3-4]MDI9245713.1 23S rRNA (cytidine(2498)-2'-O)-methyltransferase RlmM [Marinobacter sp. CHS3-4]
MEQLMAFCRPGFEADAGRELTDAAASVGAYGYFEPGSQPGLIKFSLPGPESMADLLGRLSLDDLVFSRDWFVVISEISLPKSDRVGAVIDALREVDADWPACSRVEIRLGETNEDHDLGNFARKWVSPLSKALRGAGILEADAKADAPARLELLLVSFEQVIAGFSLAANRARYPSGIVRLRLPAEAPSRSALKLEEAWKVFIPESRQLDYLGGGKQAVDLGAAPGGWTWQLVRQGMLVTAVDNGPMNAELMASGQVTHIKADGYQWLPKRGVDWMVCDIVDHPRRTTEMVIGWLTAKLCRYVVFNLKMPMKKRYDEWLICRDMLEEGLAKTEMSFRLKARHLYHDREEITCFIERLD